MSRVSLRPILRLMVYHYHYTASRFKRPIFLSLDLPTLHSDANGVSAEMSGRWSLMLEKLIVTKLEQELAQDARGSSSRREIIQQPPVEPVGR